MEEGRENGDAVEYTEQSGMKLNFEEEHLSTKVFERNYYSSSSDDEDFYSLNSFDSDNVEIASKRLDYMIQFLDRKLATTTCSNGRNEVSEPESLPEFIGSGGGNGIFKVPVRSAVHPARPPSLEVRPRPPTETQLGCFLRTIECTETQLWAGGECGVRYWNFSDLYSAGCRIEGMVRSGDEEAASFHESDHTSATLCLVADAGNRVVWSGHRDGKIRLWKMDRHSVDSPFREGLSWLAHRGPVLSMVMSSYGDLWSGSESGVIKIWPWEAIEKSLSLTLEERHMAALIVERSYIDLRSQVFVNGASNIFTADVKFMVCDNSRGRVWSAGHLSFALWDARTRELLKVFNVDGQIDNRVDISSVMDLAMEDEMKMRFVPISKKEKPQSPFSFLQISRNAIIGAADAVRRVTIKGAFGDDNRRTEAIAVTIDGMIWTGCMNGALVQWDGDGNRLHDVLYHSFAVQCICTIGSRIWVGYLSGTVQVLDLKGKLIGEWVAHRSPIIKMAIGAGYIFTLANDGGLRGWNITSLCPLDNIVRSELSGKEFLYTRLERIKVLVGTWNVAQGRASQDSLISWLGSSASNVDIVVVGLQEVEMGAGVLAMSAMQETVGIEGSTVGQWWLDLIGKTLDEGSSFERVGYRQLAGLLIAVWVRNNLRAHVGDVDAAAVPCGFGRTIGNKGAVGLRMRVYDRIMCFVNCHFAAHLEAVNRRNSDYDHVYRNMIFSRPSNVTNSGVAGVSSSVPLLRSNTGEGLPELSEADMVVFLGDFNYRLYDISYDEARDFVSQRCFDWLKEKDQLRAEMKAGKVFQGMREGIIRFPPTYKFEKHQAGLAGYDSGEKKRIPAWCDRILYRDSRSSSVSECNLDCPVVSTISQYEACMDVTDSDHKPVRCIFSVDVARVDESERRQVFREIIESNEEIKFLLEKLQKVPETVVSTNNIILQNHDTSILRIANKSGGNRALFEIICEGESTIKEDGQGYDHHPRGSFGFPRWLEVTPAAGIIEVNQIVEVSVRHEEFQILEEFVDGSPQNCWCEETKDKEVILVVDVSGSFTTNKRSHRIRVRCCFPLTTTQIDSKSNNSRQPQGNLLHRSDMQHLGSSSDVVSHIRDLHGP